MSSSKSGGNGGMSFCGVLTLILVVLKLAHLINWSWWLVLCPLWAFVSFVILVLILMKIRYNILRRRWRKMRGIK